MSCTPLVPSGRLQRLLDDRRGAVAMLVALAMLPLTVATGLAIDAGRYMLARARLSQAADAAALAAGSKIGTGEFRETAERVLRANFPEGYLGLELDDVEFDYDEESGRITLETRAHMPTAFMRVVHVDTVPVRSRTVVMRSMQPMELALVLDVTGSMACCGKIEGLKRAAADLVEIVFGGEDVSQLLRVAVVPFSARVNVGNQHRDWLLPARRYEPNWRGCVESRPGRLGLSDAPPDAGWFVPSEKVAAQGWHRGDGHSGQVLYDPPCPPQLLPLESERRRVLAAISDLSPGGTTRIDMGARWGWRVLSPRWEGLWGEDPRHPDADAVLRAMVIMTDGDNVTRVYDEVDDRGADDNLLDICDSVKAQGFLVYAVTFQAGASADRLMERCATSSAHFFRSPTSEDLQRAFRRIGSELSALRIAE